MADVEALSHLAHAYGIEPFWHDIWGGRHEVTHETLRALLGAMHVPAATDDEVRSSLAAHRKRIWAESVPPVQVVRVSDQPLRLTLRLPAAPDGRTLHWRLDEEHGLRHEGVCEPHALEEIERTEIDGDVRVARRLVLDLHPAPGYHRFTLSAGETTLGQTLLAAAPQSCYLPPAVADAGRVFGPTAQLYTLRSRRNWGIGDFTDLRIVLEQWGRRGAALVGLNPLHALFPHAPERTSPYSPSSRLFHNVLYLDPELIEEFHESAEAQQLAASPELVARLKALRTADLVDYPGVAAAKMQMLELLYATFRAAHLEAGSVRVQEWHEFRVREGEQLRRHALFEALQEHFHRADPSVWGWPLWPPPYRDPDGAGRGAVLPRQPGARRVLRMAAVAVRPPAARRGRARAMSSGWASGCTATWRSRSTAAARKPGPTRTSTRSPRAWARRPTTSIPQGRTGACRRSSRSACARPATRRSSRPCAPTCATPARCASTT